MALTASTPAKAGRTPDRRLRDNTQGLSDSAHVDRLSAVCDNVSVVTMF